MRRISIPAFILSAALAAAACASSAATQSAPASAAPAASASAPASAASGTNVDIKGFAFAPPATNVKVGDTVTWTNQDTVAHTATLDDKSVDSGNLAAGATFSHAFPQAGTFAYHCSIHPQMKGTITVG
ncbi:MAG TPA: cupredoxin family copper-binding protein [Candidatus Limnocylindrales bacterium]|nr:cupredoxin family copper-binding protein [Candidatus Limnocylindrales bacterium]